MKGGLWELVRLEGDSWLGLPPIGLVTQLVEWLSDMELADGSNPSKTTEQTAGPNSSP
jgi:hypothetical protein